MQYLLKNNFIVLEALFYYFTTKPTIKIITRKIGQYCDSIILLDSLALFGFKICHLTVEKFDVEKEEI